MRKFLVRQIRDDSPAQQRPKWVSAVKSPLRGGAPSTVVAAVPETTFRSPWLVDPILANIAAVSGVSMASVGVRSTTFRWLEFVDSRPNTPVDAC
jgi:hypothetical protein